MSPKAAEKLEANRTEEGERGAAVNTHGSILGEEATLKLEEMVAQS